MASESISKSVVWQLSGKFALQGIAFFTTPIFTRLLTPADYGYTALYASWLSIIELFIGLQINASIGNARIKYAGTKIYGYLSSIMTIAVISFLFFLAITFVFRGYLAGMLGLRKDLVVLLPVQGFMAFVISFVVSKLDSYKQVEKSALLSLIKSLLVIGVSLFFVLHYDKNRGIAKIYGQAVPTILLGCVVFVVTYTKGKMIWNKDYAIFCLSLSLPQIFHSLGSLIFSQSDRIMLQRMQGETSLGIYSVSYTLCQILAIIYFAMNTAWVPFYYDYKQQGRETEILDHSRRYIKFFTLICMGFILLVYDVYKFLAPAEYWEGMRILPVLVVAFYFGYLYLFPVNFEFYNCKVTLIPIGTFTVAIINVVANYLLIPRYGIIGAAMGTLIAYILLFIFHEIISVFIMKEHFEYKVHIYIPGLIALVAIVVLSTLLQKAWYIRWGIAILIGIYMVRDVVRYKSLF